MLDLHIFRLSYGFEKLGLAQIKWYKQKVKYADEKNIAYLRGT
jgi:hypothetical protein